MDVSQYLEIFIEEAKEHVQSLNTNLLELEKESSDSKDIINEVFRSAHTLKGMAATMGFKKMNKLTHEMENVLSELRTGNITIDSKMLDTLFGCLDILEQYVDSIVETGDEGEKEADEMVGVLLSILDGNSDVKKELEDEIKEVKVDEEEKRYKKLELTDFEKNAIKSGAEEGMTTFGITIYISPNCMLKSARAFIIFRTLEELGSIIKASPEVQDIEDEKFDLDFSVVVISTETKEDFLKDLDNISEVEEVIVEEISLDNSEVKDKEEVEVEAVKKEKPKKKKPITNRTIRVDIDRLDTLMNLVSELIIIKNGLETVEQADANFTEQIEYLERITTNLHDAVMKVRMVPIERVFNRFPRLIRDLSRKLNKKMILHMSGEDTELDRTVIDEIGDPLVHLIRNAGDHGLETPEVRLKNGKDETGNIHLRAYQDGNNVVIEVGEDGAGIDVEKVKAKGIGNGVITQEQADFMTDKEIVDLLFRPSFSTAESISDVSGRGVGLDVVKTKVEALGGIIEVETELGEGSTFTIRLPLTLAIIQALMVELSGEKYAIPLNTIQNIEEIKLKDIKYIQNEEVINLRGQVIPIIRLHKILDLVEEETKKDSITVVVVSKGDKKVGFVVDKLIGQQEIVIKSLGKYLMSIKMIAGATILGDGEVALILDINTLI